MGKGGAIMGGGGGGPTQPGGMNGVDGCGDGASPARNRWSSCSVSTIMTRKGDPENEGGRMG